METYSRPASFDDLRTLVAALTLNGADYLLIGGYALFAHGYHRATTGIDLDGIPVRTLNLQGLLRTRQTKRDKDIADRIVLERALAVLNAHPEKP